MPDKQPRTYFCVLSSDGMERIESEIDSVKGIEPDGRSVTATSPSAARRLYFEQVIKPQLKAGHTSLATLVCEMVPEIIANEL